MHSPSVGSSSPYMHTHQVPITRYLGSYALGASPSRNSVINYDVSPLGSKEFVQSRLVESGPIIPGAHISSVSSAHRPSLSYGGLAQSPMTIQSQAINSPINSGVYNTGMKYIGPNQQQVSGINANLTPQQQLQYQAQQQTAQSQQRIAGGTGVSGVAGTSGVNDPNININVGGVSGNNPNATGVTAQFGGGVAGNSGVNNNQSMSVIGGNKSGGNVGGFQGSGPSQSALKGGRASIARGTGVAGGDYDINNIENQYPNYDGNYDNYRGDERYGPQGSRGFQHYPNDHAYRDINDQNLAETRRRNPGKIVGPSIYSYDDIESDSRVRKPPNAEHESKVLKLKNEKVKRELHVQEQEYKIHILEQENQSLRNQMDQMKNDYKRLNQVYTEKYSHEIDRLHLENQDYENSNKQWAGRFKDLEQKCDDLVHDKQDFEEENRKLNDKILKIQVLLHEQPIKNQMKYENANKNY